MFDVQIRHSRFTFVFSALINDTVDIILKIQSVVQVTPATTPASPESQSHHWSTPQTWHCDPMCQGPPAPSHLYTVSPFASWSASWISTLWSRDFPGCSILIFWPKFSGWMGTSPRGPSYVSINTSFTTSPIPKHLDPSKPFIVEVDDSKIGVGAV